MADQPQQDVNGITLGEVYRGQLDLKHDVSGLKDSVAAIQSTLAGQGVKVGVFWAGLGVGSAALVTSIAGLILAR
jgi:hypothetical protein